MIRYHWGFLGLTHICHLKGSIFPKALGFAAPNAILAVLLHSYFRPDNDNDDGFGVLGLGGIVKLWSGYTFVLGFLIVFRNNQAYTRFWDGANDLAELRGTWFNSMGNLTSFCSAVPDKLEEVIRFQSLLVRLGSMLYCSALQEISDVDETSLEILSVNGMEAERLQYLGGSDHKCEVLMQWIQQLIVDSHRNQVLDIPPPILSRVFQELTNGIVLANKIKNVRMIQFPFPYVQMITVMLLLHWVVTPMMASQCIQSVWWAAVLCFVTTAAFWSPIFIARELDMPFGDDANDLPVVEEMKMFNEKLLVLLHPLAQSVPQYNHVRHSAQDLQRNSGTLHTLQMRAVLGGSPKSHFGVGAFSSPTSDIHSPGASVQGSVAGMSTSSRTSESHHDYRRRRLSEISCESGVSDRACFATLRRTAPPTIQRVDSREDLDSHPSFIVHAQEPVDRNNTNDRAFGAEVFGRETLAVEHADELLLDTGCAGPASKPNAYRPEADFNTSTMDTARSNSDVRVRC
eukprot:TRINITY_DN30613_c0_g1_i1.p1 TRINITY_DN30613_c0_g1~~TRINITY_DN30613_c0_g1_i1.p1  ORF type:complete len:515 (+),score=68.48 TRINITY_DN30613_c0_g1_i1:58-1602(+)